MAVLTILSGKMVRRTKMFIDGTGIFYLSPFMGERMDISLLSELGN